MTSTDSLLHHCKIVLLTLAAFACKHNSINNRINAPHLMCGEEVLQSDAYYIRVLDKDGQDRRSPDTIIDLEMNDNGRDIPESQQLAVNAKGCFKVDAKWATVYIFDFNKHQGSIIRLARLEKGRIHDVTLQQISLEQEDYEFRECNHLPEAETIKDRMVYDLMGRTGELLDSARYKALFLNSDGTARKLVISEGCCVVDKAETQGLILISDGVEVLEYRAQGRMGESEPYTRTYPNTSTRTVQGFQELFDQAQ
jgi:hypothetical protein